MALALYRKYRPATFAEVVGQEHVTEPLRTALRAGRVNHAYLFSGPRGCGKTSSARIMARSLNCVNGPTDEPCGECDSCVNLAPNGPGSVDVVELDAASHGGVDDARELRDRAFFAPAEGRYRVFIIDEAHMVTTQGFNALLKIVEEPPEHLIFIFATTEPDKVLPTIRSRTHHYPFRLIPPGAMRELLERNCAAEGVAVEPAVYPLVIRAGGGSARDTQSVLDQLLAGAGEDGVSYERAVAMLGVTDATLIDDTVDGLAAGDGAAVFGAVERVVAAGHDPRRFAADLLDRLRDLVLLRAVPDAAARGLVSAPGDGLAKMASQAERIGPGTLTRYAEIVHNGLSEMRGATAPRLLLELLCSRMLLPAVSDSEAALLQRLERLERRISLAPGDEQGARQPAPPERPAPERPAPERPAPERPAVRQPAPETPVAAGPERPPRPVGQRETAAPPPAAPQRAEPERPRQAGGLDAAAVRRVWSEVLAAVRASSRTVEVMLSTASVQSVQGNEIVFAHTAAPLARRLSEPRNIETVAGALQQVFGGEWQVRWTAAGAATVGGSQRATPPRGAARQAAAPSRRAEPRPEPAPQPPPAADEVPPPPEPPPPPPEPEQDDEEALLAEASRPPSEQEKAQQRSPEDDAVALLEEHLGARKID